MLIKTVDIPALIFIFIFFWGEGVLTENKHASYTGKYVGNRMTSLLLETFVFPWIKYWHTSLNLYLELTHNRMKNVYILLLKLMALTRNCLPLSYKSANEPAKSRQVFPCFPNCFQENWLLINVGLQSMKGDMLGLSLNLKVDVWSKIWPTNSNCCIPLQTLSCLFMINNV